jgi:chemotaxis protein methyltransferase CheR
MVEFRRLNLIEDYTHSTRFPVIFCRNVMIYFDPQTKEEVISRLLAWLEPGGYLFVGHSEGLVGPQKALRHVGPAIYEYRPETAVRSRRRAGS